LFISINIYCPVLIIANSHIPVSYKCLSKTCPGNVSYIHQVLSREQLSPIKYQLLVHGQWFSPGTPASSTTKTGCHDIAEILLKVALNTKNQNHLL